ncbi:MAG: glycosyltransferase family 4 protein [Polyangiales bacterium]
MRLRVLVGVQDEGLNGIETYAEQVALAAVATGHLVTLLVTTSKVAEAVRARTAGTGLRVLCAGLATSSSARTLAERLVPQLHTQRLGDALERVLRADGASYDVVHLNRPALAEYAAGVAERVFVAGWYYPHAPAQRLGETWSHTKGTLPRRLVLAAKSLAYYVGDVRGYRATTTVVACTDTLASQLRAQGVAAVACPPPVQVGEASEAPASAGANAELRLLVCAGDLSHPRKNTLDAVRAAGVLAQAGRTVRLSVIGGNADALMSEIARLPRGVTVELMGKKAPHEVRAAMRDAHVFVLPSLYEEWGYVAVESILSGTPVVSYPVYPFADMLVGGFGVVATELRPEALADAVLRAEQLPRGRGMVEQGARRFGSAAVGSRLTAIWTGREQAVQVYARAMGF